MVRVTHGTNDVVHTSDGRCYVDLVSSTGAVFLGHANPAVTRAISDQLGRISCSWTTECDVTDRCKEVVGRHLPDGLHLYSLFNSGTEAADVALRIACAVTGRRGAIGFRNGHHGKAVAVQQLTGSAEIVPEVVGFEPIGFLPDLSEGEILDQLDGALAGRDVAAVFIEPMQGRGCGYAASPAFHRELSSRCRAAGALVVCDEIFTGMYRTGAAVRYPALGLQPDIVHLGKALGNGFPVSAVALGSDLRFHPKDFRFSSTYSDSPLACAAVIGVVEEMERIGVAARVARIAAALASIEAPPDAEVRHVGAAYFLDLGSTRTVAAVHEQLEAAGVLALRRETVLGLMPPATITDAHLDLVVDVMNEALGAR